MNQESIVGEIAVILPGATRVFRKHHVDFCCGGNKTMIEACGANTDVILAELNKLALNADKSPSWKQAKTDSLIEHILKDYHEKHRIDLPEAISLAMRVESVHKEKESCPHGLAGHLSKMSREMESHMQKEEQVLFPAILSGIEGANLQTPIYVMMADHEDLGRDIIYLEELTNDFTPPADACNTWRALYRLVQNFTLELMEHVSLENNILFQRAIEGEAV